MNSIKINKTPKNRQAWRLPVRVRARDRARSLRQLATLVQMHIPLEQALSLVQRQLQNQRLREVFTKCRDAVRAGQSLTDAVKCHPSIFGETVQHFVMVGEMTGNLGETLDQAAMQMEKIVFLRRKMMTALSYPVIVIVVAIGAVAFLLTAVVPTFNEIFQDFDRDLPLMTGILISVADIFSKNWYIILAVVFLLIWTTMRLWRVQKTRLILESVVFRLPILGPILFKTFLARMIRTLSTLLDNGIQLVIALPASGQASGSLILSKASDRMNERIRYGLTLFQAFEKEKYFPSLVEHMTEIGETSGNLAAMMLRTADYYEQEIDAAIENLSAILEPLLIVGLGVILGGILVALYMQIFSIVDVVQ